MLNVKNSSREGLISEVIQNNEPTLVIQRKNHEPEIIRFIQLKTNRKKEKYGQLMPEIEKFWPANIQATDEQLQNRLDIFPEGIVIAIATRNCIDEKIVGMVTSQRLMCKTEKEKEELNNKSWDESTDYGNITHHNPEGNVIEPVGLIVHPEYSKNRIGSVLLWTIIKSAAILNNRTIEIISVNIRVPGFSKWRKEFSDTFQNKPTVENYYRVNVFSDPVIRTHLSVGADITNKNVLGQAADKESEGHGIRMSHVPMMKDFRERMRGLVSPVLIAK